MADFLGSFNTATTRTHVVFSFTTHAQTGAAVAPSSAFENADIIIYRAADGAAFSATQRSSTAGITMTSPFDSITGLHAVDIDLTDNTDSGFYAAGYRYMVVLSPDTETVDTLVVVRVLAYFDIGPPPANVTQLGGTAYTSGAIPAAVAGAAGGIMIAGSNAATTFASVTCTGAFTISGGVVITSSGAGISIVADTNGISIAAEAYGILCSGKTSGINVSAGTTGTGILVAGGSTSGKGVSITTTNGDGVYIFSAAGHGIYTLSGDSYGASFVGTGGGMNLQVSGSATASVNALNIVTSAGTGNGINITTAAGNGINVAPTTGHGIIIAASGASNDGIRITGGTGSSSTAGGHAINLIGGALGAAATAAAGDAIHLAGGAANTKSGGLAGYAIYGIGGAGAASANGAQMGVLFTGGGTNTVASAAHAIKLVGTSTGDGLNSTSGGGATGNGATFTSAATNGSGVALVSVGTGSGLLADEVTVSGTTTLSGAVAFGSTFAIAGNCTITGTTTLTGAVSLGSTLGITGTTTLAALTTTGTATFNALTVSNATTLTGAVSLGSTLGVTGKTTLAALEMTTLTTSGAVSFGSTFAVTTSSSLGALSCTTLTASGAVAFQSTFAVTTSTALAALSCTTLTASGAVAFQSTFKTTGTTTFDAFTVTNALTVSGATTFTGAITATNASNDIKGVKLHASQASITFDQFNTTAGVVGLTSLTVSFGTTLNGDGNYVLNIGTGAIGSVTIAGAVKASDTVTLGALTVTNALTVSGATTLTGIVGAANASNTINLGTGAITAGVIAEDAIGAIELAADAATEIGTAVWASGTRSLTVLDEDSTTLDLDATIRAAVGLASANLDTQLTTIDDFLDTEIAAIKAVTDQFTAAQAELAAVPAANATPLQKIAWLAMLARNKITQTTTTQIVKADDGSTTVGTSTISDDGVTFTRGEFA